MMRNIYLDSSTPQGLRPVGCLNPQVSLRFTCGYYNPTPSGSKPGNCELQLVDSNKIKYKKINLSRLNKNPITQRFINNSKIINPMIKQNHRTNNPTPTGHNNDNHEQNPLTDDLTPAGCNNNSHRLCWRNLWDKTKTRLQPRRGCTLNWRNHEEDFNNYHIVYFINCLR
jgi:hypothetical protein